MSTNHWFIRLDQEELGPLSMDELRKLVTDGIVNANTFVSQDGETWKTASKIAGLITTAPPVPRLPPVQAPAALPVPPRASPPPPRQSDGWHVSSHDGNQYGPISKSELDNWVAQGLVTPACIVLCDEITGWQQATDVYPELVDAARNDAATGTGGRTHRSPGKPARPQTPPSPKLGPRVPKPPAEGDPLDFEHIDRLTATVKSPEYRNAGRHAWWLIIAGSLIGALLIGAATGSPFLAKIVVGGGLIVAAGAAASMKRQIIQEKSKQRRRK